jgi:hypothetical protein
MNEEPDGTMAFKFGVAMTQLLSRFLQRGSSELKLTFQRLSSAWR